MLQLPIARWLLDAKHSVAKRQQLHHLDLNSKDIIFEQFSLREHQILGAKISHHQWRSQNPADARAQRGHTKFASSLKPRPHPALSRLQCGMQKQVGGSGGCSSSKFWNC